ncbi:MAG: tetratricopeptide repeat protein [Elusimicrobia bacterium]|nr:tetratricopeptide repeat protein [Elusimicrobiota bacterium]
MAKGRETRVDTAISSLDSITLCRKTIFWWLPLLYLLISSAFYLRTYDSAQVKITLVQMGGVCLLGLWISRLLEEGKLAFSKSDMVCLAPFLAYMGYGIFSFVVAPYHWSSTDFFIRRTMYMSVALIVIQEFDASAVARMIRLLIWAAWVAVGYGLWQWFDHAFFPTGVGRGIDPFVWRGAFGDRVFSTYGNPNFLGDFLVIMIPVLATQYAKLRKFRLLVLSTGNLFVLFLTYTKGAWIGATISVILLGGTYLYFFRKETLRRHWMRIAAAMGTLALITSIAIAVKLRSSFTSVNFRLFTWEATWEMIMTHPLRGTGIGSFWVIYPAFRRPPIFHIEGKHNTETDHAEDEYLEVLFDEGIVGFGIFIWLLLSTFVVAYRALSQMTRDLKPGDTGPPRAYDLLGILIAFQGMMAHNFFDVSMRFVSSGVYFGLLPGLIVNLSRGSALSELHAKKGELGAVPESGPTWWENLSSFLIWPMRLAAWAGIVYMISYLTGWPRTGNMLRGFDELQGPLFRLTYNGEILQWLIAWLCFSGCVVGLGVAFLRIVALTRNPLVCLTILLMLLPLRIVWGFFRADVYHNIAIFFSKQQNWEMAVRHYIKVGELNPAYIMSFYFRGNVFLDRFNMTKIYNSNWGDKDNVPRDDFERALDAYNEVRRRAPNYVQMHHQVGALYMKYGEWLMQQGREPEAQRAWDMALERFWMYRKIDPVFPPNYYRMGHIYMMRKHYDKAAETFKALVEAHECRVDPRLSSRPWARNTLLAYQQHVQEGGAWVHRHPTSDAYTNLGNAYFLLGNLPGSEEAYKKALVLDPNNANARRNLEVLYARARESGQLRAIPGSGPAGPGAPLPPGAPQTAPPTFEIVPSKH